MFIFARKSVKGSSWGWAKRGKSRRTASSSSPAVAVEVEGAADGIGGIPKRPPDDVANPDGGEDCTGDTPGEEIRLLTFELFLLGGSRSDGLSRGASSSGSSARMAGMPARARIAEAIMKLMWGRPKFSKFEFLKPREWKMRKCDSKSWFDS